MVPADPQLCSNTSIGLTASMGAGPGSLFRVARQEDDGGEGWRVEGGGLAYITNGQALSAQRERKGFETWTWVIAGGLENSRSAIV